MSQKLSAAISVIGIDIGKNSSHVVGLDQRGAITLRQKWSRGQVERRRGGKSSGRSSAPMWIVAFAVGTPIAKRPPHSSERAQFGHSAPTSGA